MNRENIIFNVALRKLKIVMFVAILSLSCFLTSCAWGESLDRNIDNYKQWTQIEHNTDYFFPDISDESATVNEYYYHRIEAFGTPAVEIFLDISYTSENFEAEIERLEDFEYMYETKIPRKLKYDEGVLFNYPTFVAVYDGRTDYEYAIIDEENNRMIYVYCQRFPQEKLLIDSFYLPKNYEINWNSETADGYYYAIDTFPSERSWPE